MGGLPRRVQYTDSCAPPALRNTQRCASQRAPGSLTRLLRSTARNFSGQGEQFNDTIRDLSQFTTTLDNRKEDLFGTAREIEVFVRALAENDQTVRRFNDSLQGAADLSCPRRHAGSLHRSASSA